MNFKTTVVLVVLALAGGAIWLGVHFLGQPAAPANEAFTILEQELTPEGIQRIQVYRGSVPLSILEKELSAQQLEQLKKAWGSRLLVPLTAFAGELEAQGISKIAQSEQLLVERDVLDDLNLEESQRTIIKRRSHERPLIDMSILIAELKPVQLQRLRRDNIESIHVPLAVLEKELPAERLQLVKARYADRLRVPMAIVEQQLPASVVARVEQAQREPHLDLKHQGQTWTLAGSNWPVRQPEADQLLEQLTRLKSQFVSRPAASEPLSAYERLISVHVQAGGKNHRLLFGEEAGDQNRFSRPTYLRVDTLDEIVRLAPGILRVLDRAPEYYQERRLFPVERLALGDSAAKTNVLNARKVGAKSDKGNFALQKTGPNDWVLEEPVRDRVDPVKVRGLLAAVPEIWAEQFIKDKSAAECGLDKPERTLSVTTAAGETLALKIGARSASRKRIVTRVRPVDPQGMRMMPVPEEIVENFRYAQLDGFSAIFEVKEDQLDTIFTGAGELRDPRLARFDSNQATRVEIKRGEETIALVKDDGRWQLDRPYQKPAEAARVTDLLDALSKLEARDMDIVDTKDLKKYGFEPAAGSIKVDVEKSEGEGDKKTTKKETFTFHIGKDDADSKKLSVRVNDWPRVNQVADELFKQFERPALAYRSRRVLDAGGGLSEITIRKGSDTFALSRAARGWQLTAPANADVDGAKAGQLTSDLTGLEAVEFVTAMPAKEDLDSKFGLGKPELTASVSFSGGQARTLLIGKQRGDKPEYFAKVEGDDAVFVIKKDLRDLLDQSALAFMPLELWNMKPEEIARVQLDRQGPDLKSLDLNFQLERGPAGWQIVQPFQAAATGEGLKALLNDVSLLRSEKYVAVTADDLAKYGLDQPFLKLEVAPPEKKTDKNAELARAAGFLASGLTPLSAVPYVPVRQGRILLIGKPTEKDARSRFARLAGRDAVFVVAAATIDTLERSALDLLDRHVLLLNPERITAISRQEDNQKLALNRADKGWQVQADKQAFAADPEVLDDLLETCSKLQAVRFVAFGDKLDLAKYGLDKPAATITLSLKDAKGARGAARQASDVFALASQGGLAPLPLLAADQPADSPTILVGKQADKDTNERFAMMKDGKGVFVLGQVAVKELLRPPLGYADRGILKFSPEGIVKIERQMAGSDVELARTDDVWQIVKPDEKKADAPSVQQLLKQLSGLRASAVEAYQPMDLAPFGLDKPAATLTVSFEDKKLKQVVLKVGKETKLDGAAGRFVQAEGGASVGVIPQALADQLLAAPLKFRDKAMARFSDADKANLERGPRKATFAKLDGTWKLTQPVADKAEQLALEDLLNGLARLRADELVAEKAPDALYGLDKPEARWQFLDGDKIVLDLLVGKADEKDAARRYARLAGDNIVFLLSPKLTGQLLAEYRNRTPWPSFDAVAAKTIRYGHRDGPFVLEKAADFWLVKDGPQIDAGRVNEALDALARLKLDRFVADKDADPKLYGLNPPELTLEVDLGPSGKRELHIGRREGESKRYYARLPDDKTGAIFVLSEEDGQKIVRDLKGFGK